MAAAIRWTAGPETRRCTEAVLVQFGIFGRAPRTGAGVLDALVAAGFTFRLAERSEPSEHRTVRGFCEAHPRGRFYLATDNHALALVDGLLVDAAGLGPDERVVLGAVEVLPAPTQRVAGS